MNNFTKLKNRFAETAISRFGEPVRINSIGYKAVYEEQEVENETGYALIKTLSILRQDVKGIIKEMDAIRYQDDDFIVDRIVNQDDYNPLVILEIKRA